MGSANGESKFNPWPFALLGILLMTALMCVSIYTIARDNPSPFIDTAAWIHGQQFEQQIQKERTLRDQGVSYTVSITENKVSLRLIDTNGALAGATSVVATCAHAASSQYDTTSPMTELAPGIYQMMLPAASGTWFLTFSGTLNGQQFEIRETKTIS